MKIAHFAFIHFSVALAGACLAQTPSDEPTEKAENVALARAYEEAYAKADAKALVLGR